MNLIAITLRGIKSYVDGARLEKSPLTVLCGTNGSGKSTWICALNYIVTAYKEPDFPFVMPDYLASTTDASFPGMLSAAFFYVSDTNEFIKIFNDKNKYGYPGTIGLEFKGSDKKGAKTLSELIKKGPLQKDYILKIQLSAPINSSRSISDFIFDPGCCVCISILDKKGNLKDDVCFRRPPKKIKDSTKRVRGKHGDRIITEGISRDITIYRLDTDGKNEEIGTLTLNGKKDEEKWEISTENDNTKNFVQSIIEQLRLIIKKDFIDKAISVSAVRPHETIFDQWQNPYSKHELYRIQPLKEWAEEDIPYENIDDILDEIKHSAYIENPIKNNQVVKELFAAKMTDGFCFGHFFIRWIDYIVGIKYHPEHEVILEDLYPDTEFRYDNSEMPTGFLEKLKKNESPGCLYTNEFFEGTGITGDLRNFSTGFHQIAPIVLKLGLSRKGDLCTIENPEVHLHPNAQLKCADFLIQMARNGRNIIVETHSDLILRRFLRALIKEEISQFNATIWFSSITNGERGKTSVVEKLKIDKYGNISNWPDGFLTDDLNEAREMLD